MAIVIGECEHCGGQIIDTVGGHMCACELDHEIRDLRERVTELEEELKVTDKLLERVLDAIPECPAHGPGCVSYALEWIEETCARAEKLGDLPDWFNRDDNGIIDLGASRFWHSRYWVVGVLYSTIVRAARES